MPVLQVVAESRHIRPLTGAKVVRPVTSALVVVGEDDELARVEVELLLLDPLVIEGLSEAFSDVTLEAVGLLGRDISP